MPAPETTASSPAEDGLFIVQQNNAAKTLTVHRMNATIENLLGFSAGEGVGLEFKAILGTRIAQLLSEEMEYGEDAPDLDDVLMRQRDLVLRHHRTGQEIKVQCTISRLMSDGVHASFQFVIPNEREELARQKIRDFIALNLEGRQQLDAASGLPDHQTAVTFLPFLKNYLTESKLEATLAVLRIDRHPKNLARYGSGGCATLLKHAANCCGAAFRSGDLIFALSDHTLGLLLFDISRESARVVLNRLRWNIGNHQIDFGGKANFSVTVSIGFDVLDAESDDGVLTSCEEAMAAYNTENRNGLIELGQ